MTLPVGFIEGLGISADWQVLPGRCRDSEDKCDLVVASPLPIVHPPLSAKTWYRIRLYGDSSGAKPPIAWAFVAEPNMAGIHVHGYDATRDLGHRLYDPAVGIVPLKNPRSDTGG